MNLKKFAVFIALLTTSIPSAISCGYYPFGEQVRYNFLKPEYLFPNSGDYFFYTSNLYSNTDDRNASTAGQFEENCILWSKTFDENYSNDEIFDLIYTKTSLELKTSKDPIVQYLNQPENKKYLDYLLFAKSISNLNGETTDPWEREDEAVIKSRKKAWEKALKKAKAASDPTLKRRYAHLAIRLAYYNYNEEVVKKIYANYFKEGEYNDAIDYWALHFKLYFDDYGTERNVKIALVFLNSPEKRNAVFRLMNYSSVQEQLDYANTDEERIAVYYMNACMNNYMALDAMRAISEINPKHECLDFLALRELNKLEDWVYTSHYSNFTDSKYHYYDQSDVNAETIRLMVSEKREYAAEIHALMLDILPNRPLNDNWWGIMTDYCSLISLEGQLNSEDLKSKSASNSYTVSQQTFLKRLYLLNVFINDEDPELKNPYVQELLMSTEINTDQKLLISLAKELESHGHTEYSSVLFSKVNLYIADDEYNYEDYGVWRTNELAETLGDDVYYDYFTYLDATLSTTQVQSLISHLEYKGGNSEFDTWLYSRVKKESTRFYDMLGTMYMRKNDLKSALSAFEQVDDTLWTSDYYHYRTYIGKNPFSNDFYGKSDGRHQKEIKGNYTKPKIVSELLKQLNIVKTGSGDKKALAAYKVANCYRNMSYYGNSWMMRRYFWTSRATVSGLIDDEEYYKCSLAKKYYEIAEENASKKDFKAISVIMSGLCDKYEMAFEIERSADELGYSEENLLFKLNPSYKRFKKEFGDEYRYAIGNCEVYQSYFESIK